MHKCERKHLFMAHWGRSQAAASGSSPVMMTAWPCSKINASAKLRALIHKAFTPRMIENLRGRIQEIADNLLDSIEGEREFDLLESYGFPLPITVIAELLGIPASDRDRFRAWTKALLFGLDEEQGRIAVLEFTMYMHAMIEERQEHPKDDLISALVAAEESGDKLDRMELLSMIFLLLVAGHETTVNLIGNGTLALLQNPDQMQLLRDNPTLIKSAIEEMLRYNGPVETPTLRWAFEDVRMGDTVIPQGDIVMPSLLAANRDPAHFPDPDRFDIRREPNKHIAFGNGIHYCLGAPLARLEGEIAMNTLLRRLLRLELNTHVDDLQWNESLLLHGMKGLPVRV
jgi:cytochrome P450